jgi:TonB-dependent SusC/RagA subfamily outer membrane receptor
MRGSESAREHATTLAQLLQGRLAGVTVSPAPDGGIIVRMGGPTSFYGDQSPLFVVDGVTIDGNRTTLSWLNPQDVETVQALKDPSQTAIYGVRGANGVIVIKTKGSH